MRSYADDTERPADPWWAPVLDAPHLLLCTAAVFILILPWIVVFYPGIMEIDTCFQIAEHHGSGYGDGEGYTNLYPLFCVWFFGNVSDFFSMLAGDQRMGALGLCLVLSSGMSACTAAVSCYLGKWGVHPVARFIPMAAFALSPAFPLAAIDIGKDTLFCLFLIPFFLSYAECVRTRMTGGELGMAWKAMLPLHAVLVALSVSKGMVIVAVMLVALLAYTATARRDTAIVAGGSLVASVCAVSAMSMLVVSALVPEGNSTTARELLGTPIQQTAFVAKYNDDLDSWERASLDGFYQLDEAVAHYDPAITDHTKNFARLDAGSDKIADFIGAYISIGSRHAGDYMQVLAQLYNGYYEVGTYDSLAIPRLLPTFEAMQEFGWTSQDNLPNDIDLMQELLGRGCFFYSFTPGSLPQYANESLDYGEWGMYTDSRETRSAAFGYVMGMARIPVLNLLVSKSFYVLYLPLLLLLVAFSFAKGGRAPLMLVLLPLALSSLIAFASPVDFTRYAYPCMFLSVAIAPIVLSNIAFERE